MGVKRKICRRKTEVLHVRLTPENMAILRDNCANAGYLSLTKYITDTLIYGKNNRRYSRQSISNESIPNWLNKKMDTLTQQIKGIATNYNQSVTVMNSLSKNLDDRKIKYLLIRHLGNLNSLTKEMIEKLHDVRSLIERITKDIALEESLSDD